MDDLWPRIYYNIVVSIDNTGLMDKSNVSKKRHCEALQRFYPFDRCGFLFCLTLLRQMRILTLWLLNNFEGTTRRLMSTHLMKLHSTFNSKCLLNLFFNNKKCFICFELFFWSAECKVHNPIISVLQEVKSHHDTDHGDFLFELSKCHWTINGNKATDISLPHKYINQF